MAEVNVAADASMDEIIENIQRTIATEDLNGHQPAASPRPRAECLASKALGFYRPYGAAIPTQTFSRPQRSPIGTEHGHLSFGT